MLPRLLLALALGPAPAADGTSPPSPCAVAEPSPAVAGGVVVVAREPHRTALVDAVREYLEDLTPGLTVCGTETFDPSEVVRPPPRFERAPRAWIDASEPGEALIYIVDPTWDRVLVRRLDASTTLDEVTRDEIGHVLRTSFEALLAGATLGIVRKEASAALGLPEPAPPPRPPPASGRGAQARPPPARARPTWRPTGSVAAGYSARAFGREAALHGPALELSAGARRGKLHLAGIVWGEAFIPSRRRDGAVHLAVDGGTLRAGLEVAHALRPIVGLGARALVGVDLLRERSGSTPAVTDLARTRALPTLSLAAGPTLHLGRGRHHLVARLLLSLDVALLAARYVTEDPRRVVFDPWVVRPGGALVLGWGAGTSR